MGETGWIDGLERGEPERNDRCSGLLLTVDARRRQVVVDARTRVAHVVLLGAARLVVSGTLVARVHDSSVPQLRLARESGQDEVQLDVAVGQQGAVDAVGDGQAYGTLGKAEAVAPGDRRSDRGYGLGRSRLLLVEVHRSGSFFLVLRVVAT